MKAERILFPFAIEKCPPDAFAFLNSLGSAPNSTVTMLSVINLNVFAVENRIYDELIAETETKLDLLAREWLPGAGSTRVRVRLGNPADQILSEAKASNADLLVLPNYRASFWSRVKFVWDPSFDPLMWPLAAQIARAAPCNVMVVPTGRCFDAAREWRHLPEGPPAVREQGDWPEPSKGMVCPNRVGRRRFHLRFS